ncbi:ABC transporter permease [Amycolatopsis sp. H20-H5]|uniref:ABC transporter permease n=1 Tax=Amycolatopsis sp. H20-H5 TaxID=3046309 RepID=UPI002DBA8C24|nr:ABC transporter permease [Amycolatopsis sp. H20-H5]MEC3979451.1 ABC transporter permease [Amycolatopsis sp. H20-H5]
MTGDQRTTRAGTTSPVDERAAEELEAERRLADAQEARRGKETAPSGRAAWKPLPRRTGLKPAPALVSIRTPISTRARWTLMVLSFVIPFVAWAALSASAVVDPTFLPSPGSVLDAGLGMASSGELFSDLGATTGRVLYGFGLAVLVSVPLGIVMGTFAAGQALFEPVIGLVRYLPVPALVPLLIIWLGIGEESKIALLFIGSVFFNTLMTADVVRGVPRLLIDASYTLGARRGEVLRKIVVPHSLPGMIDAVRVNMAAAWGFVVVAELVAAESGLGYRIIRLQRFLQTDKIFAVLIVIGLVGLLIDVLLRLLRTKVGRWAA